MKQISTRPSFTTFHLGVSALGAATFLTFCSIDDENREFGPDPTGQGGDSTTSGGQAGERASGMAGEGGSAGTDAGAGGGGVSEAGGAVGIGEGGGGGGGGGGGTPEPPAATGGAPDVVPGCTSRCTALGEACEAPGDCESGRCVDGVCCESSCTGPCEACSGELTGAASGVCAAVLPDTDPDDDCEDEGAESCGSTGQCDGEGACALYPSSTVCGEASCSEGTALSERLCDGEGACEGGNHTECTPYACGANECRSSCTGDDDCASGSFCVIDKCGSRSQLLGPCAEEQDCARGKCYGGKCGLAVQSIGIEGDAVPGGGGQIFVRGWYRADQNGQNRTLAGEISSQFRLYGSLDINTQMASPQGPGTFFLLTGEEGSDPLTRTFQFNLSDGTSVTKEVQASRSDNMLLHPDAVVGGGDPFVLFEFTGADVIVLRKEY